MNGERKSLKDRFLKEPVPFSDKRDVNWPFVRNVSYCVVGIMVVVLLLVPGGNPEMEFSNREDQVQERSVPTTIPEASVRATQTTPNYSYKDVSNKNAIEHQSAMVIAREGSDAATSLQPGAKVRLRLLENVIVGSQPIPVIAITVEDLVVESGSAIPRGSKVFGDASFDKDLRRALITWKSVQFPGGRLRPFEALAASLGGHPGLEGTIHSEALKNAIGHTMTRFAGAYAEGSMEKSPLLGSKGGHENGVKNAIAETAKDQADRYADSLKKERVWIELSSATEFYGLLTQAFRFRDPGGSNR